MSRTSADTVESLTTGYVVPRVNLLPPEVHQARKLRRLQLSLGAGVAVLAVAVAGAYFTQVQAAGHAKDALATSKAKETQLDAKKAQYADVPRTLSAIEAAEGARQTAMGQDVQWYRYLNDLTYITPKNAWLTQLTISFNSNNTAPSTNPIAASSIATISVNGSAKEHIQVAAWLDALAKEKGFANPYFSNSTKNKIGDHKDIDFVSSVGVTTDALSHRYDRKADS